MWRWVLFCLTIFAAILAAAFLLSGGMNEDICLERFPLWPGPSENETNTACVIDRNGWF